MPLPKLIHYTEGGPWHGYIDQDYSDQWLRELENMLVGSNPCSIGDMYVSSNRVRIEVTYEQTAQQHP